MVKCAAFNCRSGYNYCSKKKLKENKCDTDAHHFKHSVFKFPKPDRLEIRNKWIKILKRMDTNWNPDNFGVCELHFKAEDFYNKELTKRKSGRQRKALKITAVPSVFECYPETAKPKQFVQRPTKMALLSARRQAADLQLQAQNKAMFEAEQVTTVESMWETLLQEKLPSGYIMMKMANQNQPEILGNNNNSGQHVISIRL